MLQHYEMPMVALVGTFRAHTGEFIGPHDEAILPLEDHSYEG